MAPTAASEPPPLPSGRGMAISSDPELASKLRDGLKRAVENVTTALDVELLPQIGAADLVALHVKGSVGPDIGRSIDRLPGTAYVLMVVEEPKIPDFLNALRPDDRVIALLAARQVSDRSIATIARRMTHGQVFGLERRLPAGAAIHEVRVASYDEKQACIERVQRFAKERKLRGKYRDAIGQCLDELLMNALYVAPREALARRPAADPVDKATIAARAQQAVVVRYASTEREFLLSVRDTYGALDRVALLAAWQRAVTAQASGAADASDEPLGVHIVTNASTSVSFNQLPGVATECICTFDLAAAKLQLEELGFYREIDPAATAALSGPPAPAEAPEEEDEEGEEGEELAVEAASAAATAPAAAAAAPAASAAAATPAADAAADEMAVTAPGAGLKTALVVLIALVVIAIVVVLATR